MHNVTTALACTAALDAQAIHYALTIFEDKAQPQEIRTQASTKERGRSSGKSRSKKRSSVSVQTNRKILDSGGSSFHRWRTGKTSNDSQLAGRFTVG
jgi:hypothetical protein